MIRTDLHIHTTYGDGRNTPEEMVLSAITMGMERIGFSEHSSVPFDPLEGMTGDNVRKYIDEISGLKEKYSGNISAVRRQETFNNGQHPYAIIISCSDSRVIPESIFNAGIGDLFVIRVAGNVMDDHQLGSVEYAAHHLGVKLIAVLGHDRCGAVDAAVNHDTDGYIKFITDEIKKAIGDEKDEYKACCLNVRHSMEIIEKSFEIHKEEEHGLKVIGAVYHIESGKVDFLY